MSTRAADLPDDPAILKGFIESMFEQLETLVRDNDRLRHQLELLRQRMFGRKSEKTDPAQLMLFMEQILEEEQGGGDAAQPDTAGDVTPDVESQDDATAKPGLEKKSGHGRSTLPDHLPRVRREIPARPEDLVCDCCKQERKRFGEIVSCRLDWNPASFFVVEEVRGKFACDTCSKSVSTPPAPPRPIEKSIAEPGLLANVLVSKYADHLPLERQSAIFARHGVQLSPSTLCDWVGGCADLLGPLYRTLCQDVLGSRVVNTDDTPITVLEVNGPGTHKGHLWVYSGRGEHLGTVYDFSPNWDSIHPEQFLAGFTGFLQSDGYTGYDRLGKSGQLTNVGCNAHARRRFHEARKTDSARAHMALAFYKCLYKIERSCKRSCREEKLKARTARAVPVLVKFKEWLDAQSPLVLPQSPIGEAISYALNNWRELSRYTEDGDLDIDNGVAERAMRGIAVGRNNYLFAGSDEGGRRAAVIYSFIQTCKQCSVEPFEYLRDVIARLPTHPPDQLLELIPRKWKRLEPPQPPDDVTSDAGAERSNRLNTT